MAAAVPQPLARRRQSSIRMPIRRCTIAKTSFPGDAVKSGADVIRMSAIEVTIARALDPAQRRRFGAFATRPAGVERHDDAVAALDGIEPSELDHRLGGVGGEHERAPTRRFERRNEASVAEGARTTPRK